MVAPVPALAGLVMPATTALVHEKTGTGSLLLLVILYELDTLLHQLAVTGLVMTEVGFTVTVTFCIVPVHPFTVGVIT